MAPPANPLPMPSPPPLRFLCKYIQNNKESDSDWFKIESDATGLKYALPSRAP